jgi:hypothetical protein
MLPLVFKTANANGFTDFIDGLPPDVLIEEDYSNLGVLGDLSEPLLAAALADIFPSPSPVIPHQSDLEEISDSKASSPLYQVMVAEH